MVSREDIDLIHETLLKAGTATPPMPHEVSRSLLALERLTRQLTALTTCECGSARLAGPCSGFCDRDV